MTSDYPPLTARTAVASDIDAIVATMTTAFFDDPLWGPAFPDRERRAEQAAVLWRLSVTSALRYPWTLVTEDAGSAAVWIPPGGSELTPEEVDSLEGLLTDTTDRETAGWIMEIFDQLGKAQPSEPHFFLSLLGTHDDHRGRGLGMGLLAESLRRIDVLGMPAYLESSNPANIARYQRAGFAALDRITTATGHVVTTMWRDAR
jgi:GNAT superfamily N-acetyltransferase